MRQKAVRIFQMVYVADLACPILVPSALPVALGFLALAKPWAHRVEQRLNLLQRLAFRLPIQASKEVHGLVSPKCPATPHRWPRPLPPRPLVPGAKGFSSLSFLYSSTERQIDRARIDRVPYRSTNRASYWHIRLESVQPWGTRHTKA